MMGTNTWETIGLYFKKIKKMFCFKKIFVFLLNSKNVCVCIHAYTKYIGVMKNDLLHHNDIFRAFASYQAELKARKGKLTATFVHKKASKSKDHGNNLGMAPGWHGRFTPVWLRSFSCKVSCLHRFPTQHLFAPPKNARAGLACPKWYCVRRRGESD